MGKVNKCLNKMISEIFLKLFITKNKIMNFLTVSYIYHKVVLNHF